MAKCPNDQANKNKNENQDSTKEYIIVTELTWIGSCGTKAMER